LEFRATDAEAGTRNESRPPSDEVRGGFRHDHNGCAGRMPTMARESVTSGEPRPGQDPDSNLLQSFPGRTVGECLSFVEMSAGEVEHPVAVPGALTLEEKDLLPALEDDVHVDDRPVSLGHSSLQVPGHWCGGDRSVCSGR
jgi:hypothetical protein